MPEYQVWAADDEGEPEYYASFEPSDWQWAQKMARFMTDRGFKAVRVVYEADDPQEVNVDPQPPNPLWVFVSSFLVSAFAGVAALLRSGVSLTRLRVLSAVLNSGLVGLAISLMWYAHMKDNVYFLVGVSAVAGLGGMTTVDFVAAALRNKFTFGTEKKDGSDPK